MNPTSKLNARRMFYMTDSLLIRCALELDWNLKRVSKVRIGTWKAPLWRPEREEKI
jgi:hypothetical protein